MHSGDEIRLVYCEYSFVTHTFHEKFERQKHFPKPHLLLIFISSCILCWSQVLSVREKVFLLNFPLFPFQFMSRHSNSCSACPWKNSGFQIQNLSIRFSIQAINCSFASFKFKIGVHIFSNDYSNPFQVGHGILLVIHIREKATMLQISALNLKELLH